MTPRQVALVQQTWAHLKPHAETVAQMFYARLFELDPALRPLFRKDMQSQGRMLTSVITLAVAGLDRLETLVPTVRALGRRHATYGVEDRHYVTVGTALLDTLASGLQQGYTPDVKAAWAAVYGLLAKVMMSASKEDAPLPAES